MGFPAQITLADISGLIEPVFKPERRSWTASLSSVSFQAHFNLGDEIDMIKESWLVLIVDENAGDKVVIGNMEEFLKYICPFI